MELALYRVVTRDIHVDQAANLPAWQLRSSELHIDSEIENLQGELLGPDYVLEAELCAARGRFTFP